MTQLKAQIFSLLEGDSGITAKLANGANSIMPRVKSGTLLEPGPDTAAPFLVLRMQDMLAVDWPVIGRQTVEIYVYDEIGKSYWAIDRIIKEVREALESPEPQFTLDAGEQLSDFLTEWEFTSGEAFDDAWNKSFRFVRFGIYV